MLKIRNFFQNSGSIYFLCAVLSAAALINAVCGTGMIEDGVHHFWEAITRDNIFIGHDGTNVFPYNSRYFPSLIPHILTGLSAILAIHSIKTLLFIFTFLSYITPLFFMAVIYLNIPKNKKNGFEFAVLSFLSSILFMVYQIWTENFTTGLFLWTVFLIYFYADFNNLSKINKSSLIIFPFMLISSHPATAVTGSVILIYGIIKYLRKNISANIFLKASFVLLFIAIVFNVYFIINPIVDGKSDYYRLAILKDLRFAAFIFCMCAVVFISVFKRSCIFLTVIFTAAAVYITLFKIPTYAGFNYRVAGFIIPLFLICFLIAADYLKSDIRYVNIKILNFALMTVFLLNICHYGINWKRHLISFEKHIISKKEIVLDVKKEFYPQDFESSRYRLHHFHSTPFIAVLLGCPGKTKEDCFITVKTDQKYFNILYPQINGAKNKLSEYSINIEDCFRLEKE